MSANFLDQSDGFMGLDFHLYVVEVEGLPIPVPDLYVAFQAHDCGKPWWVVNTVTTGGSAMLQNGWGMLFVTHVPLPIPLGPPHPFELVEVAIIIATSSSDAPMSVHSVTGEGVALLTELVGAGGLNVDCGINPGPSGADFNMNSVVTSPTLGDYCAAAVGAFLNGIYNTGMEFLDDPAAIVITILQIISDIVDSTTDEPAPDAKPRPTPIMDPIVKIITVLQEKAQKIADGI